MKSSRIIFIIIILLLIAGGITAYYLFEIPRRSDEIVYTNVSITAKDVENNRNVKIEYFVMLDNSTYKTGVTEIRGAVLQEIPINRSVVIYNNIENSTYYENRVKFITGVSNQRVTLKLVKPGELTFNKINNTFFTITSNGIFKDVKFCISWLGNIIYMKSNFTKINKPEGYEKWDKCYDANITLNNSLFLDIPLEYKTFGDIGDYKANIVFIDSRLNSYEYEI